MVDEPTLPGMPEVPTWTNLRPGVRVERYGGPRQLCMHCLQSLNPYVHPLVVVWLIHFDNGITAEVCATHAARYMEVLR